MPFRAYTCDAGHEFERREQMDSPAIETCDEPVWVDDGPMPVPCGEPCRRVLGRTQKAIVRGGTPTHHAR